MRLGVTTFASLVKAQDTPWAFAVAAVALAGVFALALAEALGWISPWIAILLGVGLFLLGSALSTSWLMELSRVSLNPVQQEVNVAVSALIRSAANEIVGYDGLVHDGLVREHLEDLSLVARRGVSVTLLMEKAWELCLDRDLLELPDFTCLRSRVPTRGSAFLVIDEAHLVLQRSRPPDARHPARLAIILEAAELAKQKKSELALFVESGNAERVC